MIDAPHNDHGAPWRSPAGGPRLGDGVERWPEERIQAEIDMRLEAEAVAGAEDDDREIRADGGNSHASNIAAQLREAEGDEEMTMFNVGDHVTEEFTDATMVVVGLPSVRANAYEIDDGPLTVADYHPPDHAEDRVVEVVFPQRTDHAITINDDTVYAYPRGVLELVHSVHGNGGDE